MSKFGQHFKKHYKKKLQCCVCYCNINKRIYHRCFKRHFRKSSQEDFEKSTHHIMCSNCERHQYRIMGESFRCPICKEKWKSRDLYTEIEDVIFIDVCPPNQLSNIDTNENIQVIDEYESPESEEDDDANDPDWDENNDFD